MKKNTKFDLIVVVLALLVVLLVIGIFFPDVISQAVDYVVDLYTRATTSRSE